MRLSQYLAHGDLSNVSFKATSKNVIPAKAGIQKRLTSLDSRLRGSNKLIIIRGSLKYDEIGPNNKFQPI
jgi:hypothetical protein